VPLSFQIVDLTRVLDENTTLWPDTPPIDVVQGESIERDGSFTRRVALDEHSGTHFDAPSHFSRDGWNVSEVPAERLVCPLHVVDLSARAKVDPDTTLSTRDLAEHEERHGRIGDGCAVFLRTDWHGRVGGEGLRFPGFGVDAARLLAEERGVVGLGIDTLGIDPGWATDFPIHRDVTLPRGVWHVENLTRLSEVPPVGSWAVIGVPRIGGASGFPARVLALVPSHLEG